MYCNFFGFSEKPFNITPDPKFLYLTPGRQEILASLTYGIRERRGFITMVGEVGTGKTTLLNAVLDRLDEKTKVAYIFNTDVTFDQMLAMALVDLGIANSNETPSKVEAVIRLGEFAIKQLAGGGNVVLIVDEAQNLDRRSMEGLRLLSNLQTRKHKLIQIVLSGQPELDAKLRRPELHQLAQRISLRRYINPLSEKETYDYIQHRLSVADYSGPTLFHRKARQMIWEYSAGVPRKINMLCDNALLIAYALRKKRIKASIVEEAITDLSWTLFSKAMEGRGKTPMEERAPTLKTRPFLPRFARAASLVLCACLVLALGLFLGNSGLDLQKRESLPQHTGIRAGGTIQPNSSDQSPPTALPVALEPLVTTKAVALASGPEEEVESEPETVDEEPHGYQLLAACPVGGDHRTGALPVAIEHQQPAVNVESDAGEQDEHLSGQSQIVVVKRGDNLFRIIYRAYGKYDRATLDTVLEQNPEIENPDTILVGQPIELPKE
jgi:general secretion pathway protein A